MGGQKRIIEGTIALGGQRLDKALADASGLSRERVKALLDDGRIRLRVESCGADFAQTRVVVGGDLSNHKGLNVPGVVLALELRDELEQVRRELDILRRHLGG